MCVYPFIPVRLTLFDDKSCSKFYILQLVCIILRYIRVKISVVTADEAVKLSGQTTRAPP